MNSNYYIGVGRRKEATARVYLKEGEGKNEVRTSQKSFIISRLQSQIKENEKTLHNLNLVLADQKTPERTYQALSVVKFEVEEKLIDLRKRLKQEKQQQWKELKDYFYMEPSLCEDIYQPLKLFNKEKNYDLVVRVKGGGFHSQAEAIRLGVARALLEVSPEYKTVLKSFSLLTRDARRVEEKKIGHKKARKKEQFSKR